MQVVGALGLESLSRGAKYAVFCDNTKKACDIINKNIEKTRMQEKSRVIYKSYEKALKMLKEQNEKLDIVFLDPPYNTNYDLLSIEKILEYNLLSENGIMIVETKLESKHQKLKDNKNINIYDVRKYGDIQLIFMNRKG